jgi:hypothetical protein
MYKIALTFVLLMSVAFSANAEQEKFYFGLTLGGIEYQEPDFDTSLTAFTGRFGYAILENLDVEGRYIGTPSSGSDGDTELSIDAMASVLVKYKLFLQPDRRVNVHGFLGTTVARTSSNRGGDTTVTNGGLSLGLGVDLYADDKRGVNIEWIHYMYAKARHETFSMNYLGIGYIQWF